MNGLNNNGVGPINYNESLDL